PVGDADDGAGDFDTVVVGGSVGPSGIARAAHAVRAGGHLVVEVESLVGGDRSRAGRPGDAVRIARALAAGGFDVRSWWAWPALGRAAGFASFEDRAAIKALVRSRAGRRRWASLAPAVSVAARARVFPSLVPGAVLVARRGPAGPTLIERRLDVRPDAGGSDRCGCLLLTPRYRASAHVVGLAVDGNGRIDRVAKVARLRDDVSLVHEAAVLRALAHAPATMGTAPTLIDAPGLAVDIGEDPWPILVEGAVDGPRLEPAVVRADRAGALAGIERWLATLPVVQRGADEPPDDASASRIDVALAAVEGIADGSPAGDTLRALAGRTRGVVARLAGTPLPRVFEHGDAAHPNLISLADGRIGAVDWERGEPDGLPLHDLSMATAYLAAAAHGATRAADQAAAYRAALSGTDAWAADALDREAIRVAIPTAYRPALVVAAWARSAGWLATRLGGESRSADDRREDDLVTWLAGDRSVALWAVALDLAEAA
ncbi:MAG: hypothetical protein ACRDIL_00070, partial [Candidatus Limnocylindrales bacterium]